MTMRRSPTFPEFLRLWLKVGCLSFGGPAGQIALMHRLLVDERKWLDEAAFLRALNVSMLLPGPEAQQLAVHAGWRLFGVRGGIAAGTLFVLPGALVMFALVFGYAAFGTMPLVAGALLGVKAVVLAVVIEALLRLAKRALLTPVHWALAAGALVALALFEVPFPLVVLGAAVVGAVALPRGAATAPVPFGWQRAAGMLAIGTAIWLVPLALLALWLGGDHVLAELGGFFAKLAVVTFGGAYAALAYVAQAAVETKGWLTPAQMIDGLGLAETTPGPLILVLQFVGALAAGQSPAPFAPWVATILGGCVALWAMFVPSTLFALVAAPAVDALQSRPRLSAALAGVTAAVVGVIANLALWFALHTVVVSGQADWVVAGMVAAALVLMLRFRVGLLWVLALGAGVGVMLALSA